jgi:hypothetical protein
MGLYVYGVVQQGCPAPDRLTGIGPDEPDVQVTPVDDRLAVVASELPADAELGPEEIIAHRRVIEEVFTRCTILPFRFGTAVADEEDLHAAVAHLLPAWRERLQLLEGKVEVEVIAAYDEETVLSGVMADNPGVRELAATARDRPEMGSLVQLGEAVAEKIDRWRSAEATRLMELLGPLAAGHAERAPRQDLRVRVALLVDRQSLPDVESTLEELAEHDERITVELIGPLPPYTFAAVE